jgi:short-subunit dehydrogenase
MQLKNKIALITGGSSGIGLALARRLVQDGASVALVARSADKLEAAAAGLRREPGCALHGSRVIAIAADVADRAALDRLPQQVVDALGGLDILINNAGVNHRGPALGQTPANLAQVIDVNLTAPVYLSRRALDVLRPGGAIVQISSLAGKVPFAEQATYSASKSGLRFFSRALGEELASRDIHVLCVNPGPVDTDFFEDIRKVSDITFSQPMSTAEEVAEVTLRALALREVEVDLPQASGWLATLGYLSPGLKRMLRPILAQRGARNKERYLRKKGLL